MEKRKGKFKDFEFELFGTKWLVKFVDRVCIENADPNKFYFGHCDSIHNVIQVTTKDLNGGPIPDDTIVLSLVHEMIHSVFDGGGYINTNEDEPLVEWTAKCVISLLKQKALSYVKQ